MYIVVTSSYFIYMVEVQDLGLDLLREMFVLVHPRATSPIDFSNHALETLT
jgi:hypothetical protein